MNESFAGNAPMKTAVTRLGPFTVEEFTERARSFHGCTAPGLLIGAFMVDLAMRQMPPATLYDAICETFSCLPDSIQLLTPCTVGNGWLRIVNMNRYALSLYDKYKGDGVRVFLDPKKVQAWSEIQTWFFKLKPKRAQDTEKLIAQIWEAGEDLLTLQHIRIKTVYLDPHCKGDLGICATCGEAYPVRDGSVCLGCQGKAPFELLC